MAAVEALNELERMKDAGAPSRTARRLRLLAACVLVADSVVLIGTVLLAWDLRFALDVWASQLPMDPTYPTAGAWIVLAWVALLGAQGAYAPRSFGTGPEEFRVVALASLITAGLVGMFCYLVQLPLSRGFVLLTFAIGTPALLVERYVIRKLIHRIRTSGRMLHRVVAVGGPSGITEITDVLERERYAGYQIVAACIPGGAQVSSGSLSVPVLGGTGDIREVCAQIGADTVLVARGGYDSSRELRRIAWALEGSDVELVVVPSLTDIAGPRISMRPVAGLPLLHVEEPQASAAGGVPKRIFDFCGALLALTILSPVMLAVILAIKLEDGGPILFRQKRIGRDGGSFDCFKFRSMHVEADLLEAKLREQDAHRGALWKRKGDPRITRVGSTLRRYSLDELPQLLNVLRGEMSLVGPRPQQAWEVENYDDAIRRRLLVRPGMTGLWQVSGRSELSWKESVRLDLYYVDNWSMLTDLVIMAKTVRAVFGSTGAY